MNPKRILIISYYFAPQNTIGAVRPTKLAKYLTRMGHEVTVICGAGVDGRQDPTLARDLEELPDVHMLHEWNPLRELKARRHSAPAAEPKPAAPQTEEASQKGGVKAFIRNGADVVYRYLHWLGERSFQRCAIRELKKLSGTYDVVFSSYSPAGVHEAACRAKCMGVAKHWIADFRDEVGFFFRWQAGYKKRFMRRVCTHADLLCGVSQGILDMMGIGGRSRVLHNGFDRDDLPETQPSNDDADQFRVVYCGQFDMGRAGVGDRDITPFLRILQVLVDEGRLKREQLRLVYAGNESDLMRRYAAACDLEDCLEDHGLVSRKQSIALQRSADILLMASWHMPSQRGILTGKLFEYMMMGKPIVCCMRGDLPDSAVKQVIAQTALGFCWEEATAAEDDAKLLSCTRKWLERWEKHEDLLTEANETAVESFAYSGLAKTLDGWVDELQG